MKSTKSTDLESWLEGGNHSINLSITNHSKFQSLTNVLQSFEQSSRCKKVVIDFSPNLGSSSTLLHPLMEAIGKLHSVLFLDIRSLHHHNSVSLLTYALQLMPDRLESLTLKHVKLQETDQPTNIQNFIRAMGNLGNLQHLVLHKVNTSRPTQSAATSYLSGFSHELVWKLECAIIKLPNIREVEYGLSPFFHPHKFCSKPQVEKVTVFAKPRGGQTMVKVANDILDKGCGINTHLQELHLKLVRRSRGYDPAHLSCSLQTILRGAICLKTLIVECFESLDKNVIIKLAEVLPESSLHDLQIRSNKPLELQNVLEAFSTALMTNFSLKHLSLEHFCSQDDCRHCYKSSSKEPLGQEIAFYLNLNQMGRERVMPNIEAASTDQMIDVLSDVSHDVRCLFYYLRLKPDFCSPQSSDHLDTEMARLNAENKRLREELEEINRRDKAKLQRLLAKDEQIQRLRSLRAARAIHRQQG